MYLQLCAEVFCRITIRLIVCVCALTHCLIQTHCHTHPGTSMADSWTYWVMFSCKDPSQTYQQLDPPLRIQFLIMHYKLFSPEKSALHKCLLMQYRQCQTGDMDMDTAIKVQESEDLNHWENQLSSRPQMSWDTRATHWISQTMCS